MRRHGTLLKWNEERGFGFVAVGQAGAEAFVHASAFPRDDVRPQVGEMLSFELVPGDGGRQKAIKVQRPGPARPAVRAARRPPSGREPLLSNRQGIAASLGVLVLLAGFGAVFMVMSRGAPHPGGAPVALPLRAPTAGESAASVPAPASAFRCDGRTECAQMTSCAEAEYFLAHCPGVRLDGNGDGEPCEQQWCR